MNEDHARGCSSPEWRHTVRDFIIPWVIGEIDLGDDVLEVGPGYGATTDVLRRQVPHLTAVEIDVVLADALRSELEGSNVEVVTGDAAELAFDADRFTGVASFSMLHHVHSADLQDQIFREVRRVLRPGGAFVASDSLDSPDIRSFHHDDVFVPVDPADLSRRLTAAGFADVAVDTNEWAWKVAAR